MRREKISFDYVLLKHRIRQMFGSYKKFGTIVGCSETLITMKLNGAVDFSSQDIRRWCEALEIAVTDIHKYFFAPIV